MTVLAGLRASATNEMTVGAAVRRGATQLAAAGVAEPRLEAELLLAGQLGGCRLDLYRELDRLLTPLTISRFDDAVRRRARGEPLQYVRGWEEFYGLIIDVDPGVLIPRPETELLVEQAVAHLRACGGSLGRPSRFVDLGAGSGCVAIALARAVEAAAGLAIDCSEAAVAVARRNLTRYRLTDRILLVRGDLCEPLGQPIDLVVANLPYVPGATIATLATEVRDWEPRVALDGGPDGLALIKRLLQTAGSLLPPWGRLILEIGVGQSAQVAALANSQGWAVQSIVPDLAGIDRVMVLSWIRS